jgi:hypothetical protein
MIRALAALLLFAGVAIGADDPALQALDACRARLDPGTDIGFERIERRCPELLGELQRAPWYPLLPPDLQQRRNEVSAESLRQLAELVRASQGAGTPPQRQAPDVARLGPVLDALGEKGQEGASRWERVKRWFQEKLERRQAVQDDDEDSWLDELGRKFRTSEGVAQAITWAGYGLVTLLVLMVVYSELRAAGLLGGTRREARTPDPRSGWRRRLQLADVSAAPLADRPGLLLRMLGEALSRARRLPAPDGLTASAIARRARLDEEADRQELQAIAVTADAVRYGASPPPVDSIEGAANSARSLLAKFLKLKAGR